MITRKANAAWHGGLKEGKGEVSLGSGAFTGQYSFNSRFENGKGTNPEELIAAAHAGCFSMAFSAGLEKEGFKPNRVSTSASVTVEKVGEGFEITKIKLDTEADIPGIDEEAFQKHAKAAKENCPVSKVLSAAEITLSAKLVS